MQFTTYSIKRLWDIWGKETNEMSARDRPQKKNMTQQKLTVHLKSDRSDINFKFILRLNLLSTKSEQQYTMSIALINLFT